MLDDSERKARLAYAIRSARLKRGLTPPKLAKLVNVAPGTVNKWEDGLRVPNLLMLGPLCDALGLDANLFAILPPIPPWEGETYLMDDAADRAALAALGSAAPNGPDVDDGSDEEAPPAPAHARRRKPRPGR